MQLIIGNKKTVVGRPRVVPEMSQQPINSVLATSDSMMEGVSRHPR